MSHENASKYSGMIIKKCTKYGKTKLADNSASYSPIPICIPPDNYVFKEIFPQNWYFLNKYICVKRIKKHIGGKHHLL